MRGGMTPLNNETALRLPDGTRLLHIGPPKTGTTSLQFAFHSTRPECLAQGVRYTGVTHQPVKAARAAIGMKDPILGEPPPMRYWKFLMWEVRRASERCVIISSEFLAYARSPAIRRIVDDLDPGRVHVVVTLRPLVRILSSQWQQAVQNGLRQPFESWLVEIFDEPGSAHAKSFWLRHRHDELAARWADVVGADRVTVVALDGTDHAMVLRVFERLAGLRENTLPSIQEAANRSMTLPEAELIQAINDRFEAEHVGRAIHKQVVSNGAATYMKGLSPERAEERILLPQWAIERANEVATTMIDAIAASGVRIVGDPAGLITPLSTTPDAHVPTDASATVVTERFVPARAAAAAAIGILLMSGQGRTNGAGTTPDPSMRLAEDPPRSAATTSTTRHTELDLGSSLYLLAVLWHRVRNGVGATVHKVRRSLPRW
jgi:hypothetical protein